MVNADQAAPLLDARGIVKHFPGAKALDGVDLSVYAGEVHCLLGQNGAGKSTLVKVLAAAHQPDQGEVVWQGRPVRFTSPMAALKAGIATIYQELDVIDGLSVAENIFLGHEISSGGVSRRRSALSQARALLEQLGHPEISPAMETGQLSAAGKQVVSIARALSHNAQLIIMDEPSAVLDSEEVGNLFALVRQLTERGIGVIYISHRLEEIRKVGDRITVLKDGKSMASGLAVNAITTEELISLMTGHEGTLEFPPRTPTPADAPVVLKVENLTLDGVFHDVSFEVRAGQIVGLAGLVGSGRSEIMETIFGARRATSGRVLLDSRPLRPGNAAVSVAAGMGFCPEERKSQGLLLDEPVFKNITLSIFARIAHLGVTKPAAEAEEALRQATALDLMPPDVERTTRTLSGGNQQKILLARWLAHGVKVLFLDEPTRGVDVGARAEAYELICSLAASGVAVVLVSSELEEVIGLAETILVVSEGRIVLQAKAGEIDEQGILGLVMEGSAV